VAWWNPLDWAAKATADALKDGIDEIFDAIKENPQILLVPVGLVAGGTAVVYGGKAAAKSAGSVIGESYAKEWIK